MLFLILYELLIHIKDSSLIPHLLIRVGSCIRHIAGYLSYAIFGGGNPLLLIFSEIVLDPQDREIKLLSNADSKQRYYLDCEGIGARLLSMGALVSL